MDSANKKPSGAANAEGHQKSTTNDQNRSESSAFARRAGIAFVQAITVVLACVGTAALVLALAELIALVLK